MLVLVSTSAPTLPATPWPLRKRARGRALRQRAAVDAVAEAQLAHLVLVRLDDEVFVVVLG
ncbi:MAG TPA: hypothetical protein PLG77_01995 [Burkholderiaceae bacterium]|nr:hypothetical protein [Burkholderiaceae bacterium]